MAEIRNILITGATGLIGSALTEFLLARAEEEGLEVFAGCRSEEKFRKRFAAVEDNPRLHFFRIDVTKPVEGDIPFHYIIHAASNASPNFFATDPVGVMKANLLGVCHLMDYGATHQLERFLLVSSGEVYGERDGDATEEHLWREDESGYVDTMTLRACYPSSKRAAETLAVAYAQQYGVETVVARLCHTYGRHFTDDDNRAYAQFVRNVRRGEDIVLKSKGEQFRSWIFIDDCVSAIHTILKKGKSGEAYNVADEQACLTIRELAETIAAAAGRKVVFDIPAEEERRNETPIRKALFDTRKLRALGWKPQHCIREALRSIV